MSIFTSILVFAFGAIFGSFSGATAWRLHKNKNITTDRSECERCHHKLSPLDLIPIFSWLILGGRCRYCRRPIGYTPFLIEILSGVAFLASFLWWPFGFSSVIAIAMAVLWAIALVLLGILFVYDLRWGYLPDAIVWPLVGVGMMYFVLHMFNLNAPLTQWPQELVGGLIPIAGVYGLLYLISKGAWIGLGDVKYGFFAGLVLDWKQGLVALVLANFLGLLAVVPGLIAGKLKKNSQIPFGPFLIISTVIAFLAGTQLIEAYLRVVIGI